MRMLRHALSKPDKFRQPNQRYLLNLMNAGVAHMQRIRELHPGTGELSVTIGSGWRLSRHM